MSSFKVFVVVFCGKQLQYIQGDKCPFVVSFSESPKYRNVALGHASFYPSLFFRRRLAWGTQETDTHTHPPFPPLASEPLFSIIQSSTFLVSPLVYDGVRDDIGEDQKLAQADGQPEPDVVDLHKPGTRRTF